ASKPPLPTFPKLSPKIQVYAMRGNALFLEGQWSRNTFADQPELQVQVYRPDRRLILMNPAPRPRGLKSHQKSRPGRATTRSYRPCHIRAGARSSSCAPEALESLLDLAEPAILRAGEETHQGSSYV